MRYALDHEILASEGVPSVNSYFAVPHKSSTKPSTLFSDVAQKTMPFLPTELLSRIFELCDSKSTLANAALCSQQWYDIVMPHLYGSIDLNYDYCSDDTSIASDGSEATEFSQISHEHYGDHDRRAKRRDHQLRSLAILFMSKPTIAAHVKHLSVWPPFEGSNRRWDYSSRRSSSALTELTTFSDWNPIHFFDESRLLEESNPDPMAGVRGQDGPEEVGGDHPEEAKAFEDPKEPQEPSYEILESSIYMSRTTGADELRSQLPEPIKRAWKSMIPEDSGSYDDWIAHTSDCEDVYLALILPLLVNLETLDLEVSDFPIWVATMFWCAVRGQLGPVFEKLKSMLWSFGESVANRGDVFAGIFALPSIEKMYIHRLGYHGEEASTLPRLSDLAPRSGMFTQLEIRSCTMSAGDMQDLLGLSKGLKSFIYEEDRDQRIWSSSNFSTIRAGIESQQATIEEFCVGYSIDEFSDVRDVEYPEDIDYTIPRPPSPVNEHIEEVLPMESMKYFSRLKHIRLALIALLGSDPATSVDPMTQRCDLLLDFLPASIETLQLTHCEEPGALGILASALQYVFQEKAHRVKMLQAIVIQFDARITELIFHEWDILWELARMNDVDLTLFSNVRRGNSRMNRERRVRRKWGWNEDVEWHDHTRVVR